VAGRLRGLPELKGPLLVAITGYGQEEEKTAADPKRPASTPTWSSRLILSSSRR
jgi:hypothetical protein